jgi:hypothetical protein
LYTAARKALGKCCTQKRIKGIICPTTVGYQLGDRAQISRGKAKIVDLRSNCYPSTRARKRDGKTCDLETAIARWKRLWVGKEERRGSTRKGSRALGPLEPRAMSKHAVCSDYRLLSYQVLRLSRHAVRFSPHSHTRMPPELLILACL